MRYEVRILKDNIETLFTAATLQKRIEVITDKIEQISVFHGNYKDKI